MAAEDVIAQRLLDPDPRKIAEILEHDWASHNIPLAPGRSTMEGRDVPLIGDDPRTQQIRRVLAETGRLPEGGASPKRLLDLGALEGGLSFEMARLGFEVLCVEGRTGNAAKCELIRDYFGLETLEVLESDVRSLSPGEQGLFEVILCCGLLYHLDRPFDFLALLSSLLERGGLLFIDSHVAPVREEDVAASRYAGALSPLVSLDESRPELQGRWIQEHDPRDDGTHAWASIDNPRSFWATKEALLLGLEGAGFSAFFEVFGAFPLAEELELKRHHSRVYLVATKD